jgi:Reverse transcriptase (RNA-dependent DNA polymerase)
MMHGHEKSDLAIVAGKPANKAEQPAPERSAAKLNAAELVERRAGTEGNADQQSTRRTQSRESMSQALERIRKAARERKKERFTALFHHISIDLLERSFFELKEDAAPGVDRLTWKDYEADLERKLEDLHDRVQRGAYRALPNRRVYIPKPDGRQRPLAWRRREATGDMIIVRYADDFIIGFEHESDARRFLDEMRERLGKFALTLHPEKTRLIEFGRFAAERRRRRGLGKPESFDFLGFTFICGKTRQGKFQIKRKTRPERMRAKLKMIKEEMWKHMHQPIPDQGKWLERVVRGYFNYHAVPTNARALDAFRHHVTDLWRRTLRRRSQRDRLTWARMTQLAAAWLPKPIVLHPWPSARFAVTHPRWEPYAGKPHVRFWAGGVR